MSDIGSSITFTLPASQLPSFEKLFEELSSNLTRLGLAGYGISDSTLYEVCLPPHRSCSSLHLLNTLLVYHPPLSILFPSILSYHCSLPLIGFWIWVIIWSYVLHIVGTFYSNLTDYIAVGI